jgi:DNA-binding MarR family transcriptional regulator
MSQASALLSKRELAAWRGMLETHSRMVAELDRELIAEHGLPLSSYEVLMNLADADGERLRMGELADRLLLSRSGITRLIDRLQRQGLVERHRCSDDGRGFFAVLTEAGRRKLDVCRPAHLNGVRRHFLATLEPGELDSLAAVWERLLGQSASPELD